MGPKENEGAVEGAAVAGVAVEGADMGPKENDGANEVAACVVVEGAAGLAKKLGIAEVEGADAVVGVAVVAGGCIVGWPSENSVAGTVC